MAANPLKGEFFLVVPFLLLILFLLSSPRPGVHLVFAESDSASAQGQARGTAATKSDHQEALLYRLEEVVGNLTEVVAKLERRLSESSTCDDARSFAVKEKDETGGREHGDQGSVGESKEKDKEFEGRTRDGERIRAFSVTKYSPLWSERFQFVSAVKLHSDATSISVLPFRDYEGLSKYFAIGDAKGRVYVFLRNGDVLVEFYTKCDFPVTAMVSYFSPYKNESLLVTGHENGEILLHRVYEGSAGEEWNSIVMESVGKFDSEDMLSVSLLEVHHVGRARYVMCVDAGGRITVFKEDGTVYGSMMPQSKPVVFMKQRLLFLTESGVGSLDLRSMKVRESECEGLNHSLARNYVFDATERSKAYGFTSEGDLIHVLLLGDIMNFKCRVRSKRKFNMEEPLALHAIKGYLLVVNQGKVFVYNVSTQHYVRTGGPRLLFSAGLDEIRSSFLSHQDTAGRSEAARGRPLIASDGEKLVVLGLGGGYIATYRSKLPVFKGEFNTVLWSSPVFFFIVFLFGAWHFFAKKKEALTSWGPDDPFSSSTATPRAPLGPPTSTTDRAFPDSSSSRTSDIMDLRRRYASPSRYPPGTAYRPTSADPSSRGPVDSNYRGSELKYRPSTLEPPGFPKRRESLFLNSQVLDDNS